MKKLILSLFILSIHSATFANNSTGIKVIDSVFTALDEASLELGSENIYAWQSLNEGHEAVVNVLDVQDQQLTYGCHNHGSDLVCHEEGHDQGERTFEKEESVTLDYMKDAFNAAVKKFSRTLTRRQIPLTNIQSLKVWSEIEDGHDHKEDHDHSANVWTKFTFENNNEVQSIFVLCHVHAHKSEHNFVCHYSRQGHGEPNFHEGDDDHDHGDDDDHGHDDHGHDH